jgi:hydroxymethylbilane synthase
MPFSIKICARDSALSKAQVQEVFDEIKKVHPDIVFEPIFVKTTGDLDKKTSLRGLERTNFFTKELDEMVLKGIARIAIHSAKDLPDPLPLGLKQVALTKGVDPSDVLVLRQGEALKEGMVIATSSERREEMVRQLCSKVSFVDIRGTIEERIAKVDSHQVDGVVIAMAALIRLGIKREIILLPGETAPLQGRLSILARVDDDEISTMFRLLQKD